MSIFEEYEAFTGLFLPENRPGDVSVWPNG